MKQLFKNTLRTVAGCSMKELNKISFWRDKDKGAIVRFNTAINTDNLGDCIIMRYCSKILTELYPNYNFIDVPTHSLPSIEQENIIQNTKLKFVCGTNILTSKIEEHWNWLLPDGFRKKLKYKNVILLGVGWKNYEEECSKYSQMIYKAMLNPSIIHSVRDSHTEQMMKRAGITNVINTGCPTMWELTPSFCECINQKKAKNVITTITCYRRDVQKDSVMLQKLGKSYETVYLWLQGNEDEEYLNSLSVPENLKLIPASLEQYEKCLQSGTVDYIGTRLHAGILALNYKVRSLVVSVDNRATEISHDTNLPILLRDDMEEQLDEYIWSSRKTEIKINEKNIEIFKNQFKF